MKKILNICVNGLYTDGYTYHENLLPKYHKKLGYDVYILASEYEFNEKGETQKAEKKIYEDSNGIKIRRLKIVGDKKITYKFKRFVNFYSEICSIAPDIIFCHLFQFIDVQEVVRYKKENPAVKVYFDSHADFSNSATNWVSKYFLHKIFWKSYAHKIELCAEKIYGVLPARVDFLIKMYKLSKEKVYLLVMGVDDELLEKVQKEDARTKIRQKYHIRTDDFLLVTGGKIDMAKKQTIYLLEAVKRIDDIHLKLIIFGSIVPELKTGILNMCDGEKIQYVGWADDLEAYEYFSAADLAVFPGRHSVYWEQVTGQGIPMIIKYWEGCEHVDLGGNIRYLHESSEKEIREIIIDTIDKEKYSEMLNIAREKGRAKFSYMGIARESIMGA